MLLEDGDHWRRLQAAAYETVRHSLPLRCGVEPLVQVAAQIASAEPLPDPWSPFFTQPEPNPEKLAVFNSPRRPRSPSKADRNASSIRRALKDLRLEVLELRRGQARMRLESTSASMVPNLELIARSPSYSAATPRVSVLTALYNHGQHVIDALTSAIRPHGCTPELIIVDDGSTDDSRSRVESWIADSQDASVLLLHHPVNRGLGHARNAALGWARGEFCFVLDADNQVYPHCLARLVEALEQDSDAAFAYGTLECFNGTSSVGL